MDERALDERLARLEERLARLEARQGALPEPTTPPPPPTVGVPSDPGVAARPLPARQPGPAPPALPVRPGKSEALADLLKATRGTPSPAALAPAQPRGRAAGGGGSAALEAQVGVKWVGWAGAILVVIGAALLIKFAYDNDWFGTLPRAVRLALMSLGGFALLAAGEVVYRRIGAVAAAGLFGAGVATLFVVSYAGHAYLRLYGSDVAFVGMALVTLTGAAVAIRGNLVSIAALSIVGGNVAPVVLSTGRRALVPLFTYLLMLQVVALVLAWWGRGPKWWSLRGLALATICMWVAVPLIAPRQFAGDPRGTVLAFSLIYAALFHAELVLSALRPAPAPTYASGFAVPVPLGGRDPGAEQLGLGVTFGLLVTAALTLAVLVVFEHEPRLYRGAWTVGIGACCLAPGLLLPRLAARRGRADPAAPPSPALALAVGYRVQAAALLVVAVPVTLSGVWVTLAWAVLGVAFAVVGATFNLSVSRVAGVLVWVLAVAHLGLWTAGAAFAGAGRGPTATWAVLFGEPIPAYGVLAATLTLVGHAIAALVREDWTRTAAAPHHPPRSPDAPAGDEGRAAVGNGTHNLNYESRTAVRPVPVAGSSFQALATLTDVLSIGLFLVAAQSVLPPMGLTFAMLAYGWALVGADRIARSPVLMPAGLMLIALAAGKWLLIDTLGRWVTTGHAGGRGYRPVYNPAVILGAALLASALALLRLPLLRGSDRPGGGGDALRAIRSAGGFAAVLIVLWGVTMEVDRYFEFTGGGPVPGMPAEGTRAKHVTLSIFWSLYAVACVALGFRLRVAGLRYFGLGLFAVTAAKVMLVDLSQVQTGYRILSFLGLGLLLLGTSVLYGKLSPVLLGEGEGRGDAAGRTAG